MKNWVILSALVVLAGCNRQDIRTIIVTNKSPTSLEDVQVNMTRRDTHGKLLSSPVDEFDQIFHTGPLSPGSVYRIAATRADAYNLDILATWKPGVTARYLSGHKDEYSPPTFDVQAVAIRLNGE